MSGSITLILHLPQLCRVTNFIIRSQNSLGFRSMVKFLRDQALESDLYKLYLGELLILSVPVSSSVKWNKKYQSLGILFSTKKK